MNLQQLKDLGVRELSVQNQEATAVNPYELEFGDNPWLNHIRQQSHNAFEHPHLKPPPLPTSGIPDGRVSIEQVEEEPQWLSKDGWIKLPYENYWHDATKKDFLRIALVSKQVKCKGNCAPICQECYDLRKQVKEEEPKEQCHTHRDGDCSWKECPQIRDREPNKTGRSCPLITDIDDEDFYQAQEQTAEGIEQYKTLQILEMHFGSEFWHFDTNEKKHISNAMHEYSNRQLVQYKAKLIAEFRQRLSICQKDDYEAITEIENAINLIENA